MWRKTEPAFGEPRNANLASTMDAIMFGFGFPVKIPAIGDEILVKVRTYENDTVMDSWR